MFKIEFFIISLVFFALKGYSQENMDSLWVIELEGVSIQDESLKDHLPDVYETHIFSGKKTDLLILNGANSNLSQNVGRTIFAKIPGINLWDMDGAGTQMNIGTRGTDAHRSIEMNMRQNGYNTNSDVFGYPENHFTVPMQGVKQIQLVRGSAALQFGSQFGGMMNLVLKAGSPDKVMSVESEQTYGSYNFFNSFNSIGGTKGKFTYYAYYDNRNGDGWRPNSKYNYQAYYGDLKYRFSEKGSISFQFSRMNYTQQIAGGLTDAQFKSDPRQSNRTRNFFSPTINIPALIFKYNFSPNTKFELTNNGIWGDRSSVQFINTPNVKDTVNASIGSFNPRQVDRDFYNGFTTEMRILHSYELGNVHSVLSGGLRFFDEVTKRRQKGEGTTGSDPNFDLIGIYGIDLRFHTTNYAGFVENLFQITPKFSATPGVRYEVINSKLSGLIDNATFPVSYSGTRNFPLFGLGTQYQVTGGTQFYGNISQAYRPYLYAAITPADQIGNIDPNLRDSKGYDVDLGFRGEFMNWLNFDMNAFYLFYGDRIGKLTLTNPDLTTSLFTTNIGNSKANGVELYMNASLTKAFGGKGKHSDLHIYHTVAYTHARYMGSTITIGGDNVSLKGNHVEGVPDWISRTGLEFKKGNLSTTLQMNFVSHQFNDANNTKFNPTGATGIVPSYTLWDWSFKWSILGNYHVSGGMNNIMDSQYFSRRINMYPGPGILPGNGRTFYLSLGIKI